MMTGLETPPLLPPPEPPEPPEPPAPSLSAGGAPVDEAGADDPLWAGVAEDALPDWAAVAPVLELAVLPVVVLPPLVAVLPVGEDALGLAEVVGVPLCPALEEVVGCAPPLVD